MTKNERNRLTRKIDRLLAQEGGWRKLSTRIGVNAGTLKHIYEGTRQPTPAVRAKLAAAGVLPKPRGERLRLNWRKVAAAMALSWLDIQWCLMLVDIPTDKAETIARKAYEQWQEELSAS